MIMKTTLSTLLLGFSLAGSQANASAFNSIYVFGDSLSDIGADPSAVMSLYGIAHTVFGGCDPSHPCPPYDNGRFSNGRVAVEYAANTLLSGGANSTNFHDYAIAGSTTGLGNFGDNGTTSSSGAYGLPGMAQQFQTYAYQSGGVADSNALYIVWGGANDLLTNGSATNAAENVANYVATLASMGAQHILVPNLANLGLTPFAHGLGAAFESGASAYTQSFNQALAANLNQISLSLPQTDIMELDVFGLFNDIVNHPVTYGFGNTTDTCLTTGFVACSNPDSYVFWDDFHPTTAVHALVGNAIVSAVPLPSAMWLFASGLFGVVMRSKYARKN